MKIIYFCANSLFQHLSPAGHLLLQHLQWCSDKILGIWWRYTGNGLAWNPSSPIHLSETRLRAPPAGFGSLACTEGARSVCTVFRGQIQHLTTASPFDFIDKNQCRAVPGQFGGQKERARSPPLLLADVEAVLAAPASSRLWACCSTERGGKLGWRLPSKQLFPVLKGRWVTRQTARLKGYCSQGLFR